MADGCGSDSDTEEAAERLPLGIVRHDLSELPLEVAMQLYERDQILWVRLDEDSRRKCEQF
eukprot:COSAG05_NODE_16232_length_350_cov_1.446215_1_plen_60_part_10